MTKQQLAAGHNPFDAIKGTSYELVTELTVQPNAKLAFKLRKGTDQATSVSYDAKTEKLTIDRTHSGITSFEKGFAETSFGAAEAEGWQAQAPIFRR